MREELDRAYRLIREGQIGEATAILEGLIRENPNNEDAWWLLANSTYAPDAKRNALNNVIRLSQNPERRAKASTMLNDLGRDPYSFDGPLPNYKEKARAIKGNGGAGRTVLIVIGLLGVLACVGCFAVFGMMLPLMEMPETYEQMGVLEEGTEAEGVLEDDAVHAYQMRIEAGQRVRITVRKGSVDSMPPFIFLYDAAGQYIAVSSDSGRDYVRLDEEIPLSGEYTMVLRQFMGIGQGAYIVEFEVVE